MRLSIQTARGAFLALVLFAPAAFAGSDLDERHVVSPNELPAVGLFVGTGGRCTGFLAGSDRVIVTAAHCVLNGEGKPAQEKFEFQPSYRDGASAGIYRARVVASGKWLPPAGQDALREAVSEDWAILFTDKPTGIAPLNLATSMSINQLSDQPLADAGYSVDLQNGRFLTEDSSCKVTKVQDFRIEHSCRGSPGSSGGPVFLVNPDGSRGPVVGVVSQQSPSSTAERLVISNLLLLASMHAIPEVDFGGRAIFVGAFVNGVKSFANSSLDTAAAR
jgi:V8-like Glu-specific endopeptidase